MTPQRLLFVDIKNTKAINVLDDRLMLIPPERCVDHILYLLLIHQQYNYTTIKTIKPKQVQDPIKNNSDINQQKTANRTLTRRSCKIYEG